MGEFGRELALGDAGLRVVDVGESGEVEASAEGFAAELVGEAVEGSELLDRGRGVVDVGALDALHGEELLLEELPEEPLLELTCLPLVQQTLSREAELQLLLPLIRNLLLLQVTSPSLPHKEKDGASQIVQERRSDETIINLKIIVIYTLKY